jgi:beta-glucosidase
MKAVVALVISLACLAGNCFSQAATQPVFRDPSKPMDVRIADLIGRMTLEEKAQQLNHLN